MRILTIISGFRGAESRGLFDALHWEHRYYSTNVLGEFAEITDAQKDVDNKMAVLAEVSTGGKRKYLPYLMVNMLGRKTGSSLT